MGREQTSVLRCVAGCLVSLGVVWTVSGQSAPSGASRLVLSLGDGSGMALVWIPPGSLHMGSKNGESDEVVERDVTLTRGFWMGQHEVTQAQWETVMGENPACYKGETRPVENVSWEDAEDFLKKLNRLVADQVPAGAEARLPTEAEWEYACRAGGDKDFNFGDDPKELWRHGNYADSAETLDVGWRDMEHTDGYDKTAPVGSFPANAWGLHDMHGNVWEWCMDWYAPYSAEDTTDPTGPRKSDRRVVRGGGWSDIAQDCRCGNRYRSAPDGRTCLVGLRVVVSQASPDTASIQTHADAILPADNGR